MKVAGVCGERTHCCISQITLYPVLQQKTCGGLGGQAFTRCPWAPNTSVRVWMRVPEHLTNIWQPEMKTCGQTNSARSLSSCRSWRSADPAGIRWRIWSSCDQLWLTCQRKDPSCLFSPLFLPPCLDSNARNYYFCPPSWLNMQLPDAGFTAGLSLRLSRELFGSSFIVSVLSDTQP